MLKNHKKLFFVLLTLLLLGMGGWFTFSFYSTKWLDARISVLMEDLRKKGSIISYSSIDFSVTPVSIYAKIKNPYIKDRRGFIEWHGQEVQIFMRPFDYFTLNFVFPGEQKVVVPQTSLPLGTLKLEGAEGALHFTALGEMDNFTFTVDRLTSFQGTQVQPLALKDLSVNVKNIRDPLTLNLALSTQLMNVEKLLKKEPKEQPFIINFVADFSGFKPQLPFPKSLAEWRDGGGVLEVRLLKMDWPPILAEVEGTLTLDESMYPLGSFSSRIKGYQEAINDMVEFGWIKKKKAVVALFVLDLFASTHENGEKQLKAPITLQNKKLSVGPAPLLKLKPVQ